MSPNKQAGFTLIEVVISMLIFAIISTISYSALQAYVAHQRIASQHLNRIAELQTMHLFIKRDINQTYQQYINLNNKVLLLDSLQNDEVLTLRYSLQDENLIREDITDINNIATLVLAKNIDKFSLRLLNDKNKWLTKYNANTTDIQTVELSFVSEYWGEIKQLILLSNN